MKPRLAVATAICLLTLLTFVQFPGHLYLQSDTQIYIPILEQLWDPTVLAKDLIVEKPHVAFTLYDEAALALRWATGLDFHDVLKMQQAIFRALGVLGVFLVATRLGLSTALSLLVAAIVSLGAIVVGPSVLSIEYEPVPRGFAVPLVLLAVGLAAHGRHVVASMAGAIAFLYHPPTAASFWGVYLCFAVARRRWIVLASLLSAAAVLWIASRLQAGPAEPHMLFTRIDSELRELQRMRASYNWVSLWNAEFIRHHIVIWLASAVACWRLWNVMPRDLRWFAAGLPALGIASMPFSYVSLELAGWSLIPQFQPMRALLFCTVFAVLLGSIAAFHAVLARRYWEGMAWLALAYLIPANTLVTRLPSTERIAVVLSLAALACVAAAAETSRRRWAPVLIAAAAVAPFFAIPMIGGVQNYSSPTNGELVGLADWARLSTPKDAVFLFPEAERELHPGVFRATALRAVYVDWKGGGQVNYFRSLAEKWWSRWQATMEAPFDSSLRKYADLGIDYVILNREPRLARPPVFENAQYAVYSTRP